jgi:serpin B
LEYKNHIHLYLPKFKYALKIDLISILNKLGMELAFIPGAADFSNLVNGACFISQFFQKTYIDLNENGTEAAAATVAVFSNSTGPIILDDIQRYMHVNHSFIYMIRDKSIKDVDNNELMLFIGSCNDFSNQNGGFKYFNIQEDVINEEVASKKNSKIDVNKN